jgi:hypothetical protein
MVQRIKSVVAHYPNCWMIYLLFGIWSFRQTEPPPGDEAVVWLRV